MKMLAAVTPEQTTRRWRRPKKKTTKNFPRLMSQVISTFGMYTHSSVLSNDGGKNSLRLASFSLNDPWDGYTSQAENMLQLCVSFSVRRVWKYALVYPSPLIPPSRHPNSHNKKNVYIYMTQLCWTLGRASERDENSRNVSCWCFVKMFD